MNTLNLLIGGQAGQGLVTIGQILARSLVRSGYSIVVTQSYQSRIRGGHNSFAIRISSDEITAPQESIDLLLALDPVTVTLHSQNLSPSGLVVVDETVEAGNDSCLKIPYRELAEKDFTNVVVLGVVACLLGIEKNLVVRTMKGFFGETHLDAYEENRRVLNKAFQWAAGQSVSCHTLPMITNPPKRLMMNGNEAIALGAISAGLKFFSFYPMTPATSIALNLSKQARRVGLIVEQAEDEIAAVNMAIGAWFTGAPSMVATSGGGFALMVEGLSLAAMTETPLLIVVAQRPGPATGLPTRTEQADMEFVLHAGHGEFPRAIFAPGSVEECFYLIRKAFELAEEYQGPVFLLTDQFLADSYRAVKPFEVEKLLPVVPKPEPTSTSLPYLRYAFTETGVSPRLLPSMSEHLVVADSDEHTEDGHLTEDLSVRKKMVEKRLKKGEGIQANVIPPEIYGDENPELLFICWGSNKGSVKEATRLMGSQGVRTAMIHFLQVWPLIAENFINFLNKAKNVVSVEGNATGQMARLIRRETGFEIKKQVLRYDGLPITPEYILRELSYL